MTTSGISPFLFGHPEVLSHLSQFHPPQVPSLKFPNIYTVLGNLIWNKSSQFNWFMLIWNQDVDSINIPPFPSSHLPQILSPKSPSISKLGNGNPKLLSPRSMRNTYFFQCQWQYIKPWVWGGILPCCWYLEGGLSGRRRRGKWPRFIHAPTMEGIWPDLESSGVGRVFILFRIWLLYSFIFCWISNHLPQQSSRIWWFTLAGSGLSWLSIELSSPQWLLILPVVSSSHWPPASLHNVVLACQLLTILALWGPCQLQWVRGCKSGNTKQLLPPWVSLLRLWECGQ